MLVKGEHMPVTMDEIVEAIFANHPKPRDPSKEKIKEGATRLRNPLIFPPKHEISQIPLFFHTSKTPVSLPFFK